MLKKSQRLLAFLSYPSHGEDGEVETELQDLLASQFGLLGDEETRWYFLTGFSV